MKTKTHITPEINAAFIAAGCLPIRADSSEVDYYHSGTDIYMRFSPALSDTQTPAQVNLTEVVVVTGIEVPNPPNDHGISSEIITLADLPSFLHFRASGTECMSHRMARQTYEMALDDFDEAHSKMTRSAKALRVAKTKVSIAGEMLDKARDVQLEATAAFFAHKPPRFHPAKRAIQKEASRH